MKFSKFKKTLGIVLSAAMLFALLPAMALADTNDTPAAEDSAVRLYADYGRGYELLDELYFGKKVSEQTVNIEKPVESIRVVRGQCYDLNIDRLTLNGISPAGYERKLSAMDNDLIEVIDSEDFELSGAGELVIAARAPVDVKGEEYSFKFPHVNYASITPGSVFYTYKLGSNEGSFSDGDELAVPDEEFLFAREMCNPDSGHPDAPMDIYVADDGETLYVFFEAFCDNTFDHGKDFAAVHVKCGNEIKTYKVHTTDENEYGRWYFDYTNSSDTYDWEHMCYVVEVPLNEIRAENGELHLAFEYYGTAYKGSKLVHMCIGSYEFSDKSYTWGDWTTEPAYPNGRDFPAHGKTFNSSGGNTESGTWWLTNIGTDDEPEYTLTLNGATLWSSTVEGAYDGSCIVTEGNITIILAEGTTNTLRASGSRLGERAIEGFGQEVVIEGAGKLNLYSNYQPMWYESELTIRGGAEINAVLNAQSDDYNRVWGIVEADQGFTLDDASLNISMIATGGMEFLVGYYGWGDITIKNGGVFESSVSGASNGNHAMMKNINNTITVEGDETEMYEGPVYPGGKVESFTNTYVTDYEYDTTFGSKPYVCIKSIMNKTVKGDADGDGEVTAKDKAILNRYLAGWQGYEEKIVNMDALDFDGDGNVNARDKAILNRYLAGWKGYEKYFQ